MEKTLKKPLNIDSIESVPRIAIIGCGAIAENFYLPALSKLPNILENLTFVDQTIGRAQKLAASFKGNQCVSDYHKIFDETDGVIIALPTNLHYSVSMDFLKRGIPVLCEKPLADSAKKTEEMVDLANKMGTVLATNYSQRLWAQFAKVKEIIMNQSLGEPVSLKYFVGEVFNWPTVSGFLFTSENAGRGIVLDRGAHVMDQICWWLGGKPEVISFQNDSFGGGEAVAHVQFKFKNCVGDLKMSWLSKFPCRFIIEFERGSIEGEVYYPQQVFIRKGNSPKKSVKLKSETYEKIGQRIVSNFINVVMRREQPLIPASEVLDSIRFTDDCYSNASRFRMPWYEILEVKNDK